MNSRKPAGENLRSETRAVALPVFSTRYSAPRVSLIASGIILALLGLWAVTGHLDIVNIARGQVAVASGTKLIQAVEGGVIRAIHVHNGSQVSQGQLLVELDRATEEADLTQINYDLQQSERARVVAEAALESIFGEMPTDGHTRGELANAETQILLRAREGEIRAQLLDLKNQTSRHRAAVAVAEAQATRDQGLKPLILERRQRMAELLKDGFITKDQYLDAERQLVEVAASLDGNLARVKEAVAALQTGLSQEGLYHATTRRQLREEAVENGLKVLKLIEEKAKAETRLRQRELRSPVAGTVEQLALQTIGGSVQASEVVMRVVPAGQQVVVEALVENPEFGFVRPGQSVNVKIDAYPFSKYGTAPAEVLVVATDAQADERGILRYPIRIGLESRELLSSDGASYPLAPGMTVTAEIVTGRRRVLDYFVHPLVQRLEGALRER